MPFLTDHTWPAGLQTFFDQSHLSCSDYDTRYFGPYNKLLSYCFGDSFDFFIAPVSPPSELSFCNSTERDSILFFVVFDVHCRPVLFLAINDSTWVGSRHFRSEVDIQMRQRFDAMLADCALPRLCGLSMLGTSLCTYVGDVATGQVLPPFEDRPDINHTLPRGFLERAWDIDILSQEGFDKMRAIVEEILANTVV